MKTQLIPKLGRFLIRISQPPATALLKDGLGVQTVQRIQQWIYDRKWAENVPAGQVAEELGVSLDELSQYFRGLCGQSFVQWRKSTRIEEAKMLLVTEYDMPTALIGESVGLIDKSNFRRQFRQLTGMTPAEWRLKHKGHISLH